MLFDLTRRVHTTSGNSERFSQEISCIISNCGGLQVFLNECECIDEDYLSEWLKIRLNIESYSDEESMHEMQQLQRVQRADGGASIMSIIEKMRDFLSNYDPLL
jgi:hypothetical protein